MSSVRYRHGKYYYRATIRDSFGKRHWVEHGGFKTYSEAKRAGEFAYPSKPKPKRLIISNDLVEQIFARFPESSTAYIPLIFTYYLQVLPEEVYDISVQDIDLRKRILQIHNKHYFLDDTIVRVIKNHLDKLDQMVFLFKYDVTDHMPLVFNYSTGKRIDYHQMFYISKVIRREIDENWTWRDWRAKYSSFNETEKP